MFAFYTFRFVAKPQPGNFIRKLCDNHPCQCLGVNPSDGKTLMMNSDCQDMFYFDSSGHMIHTNTGRCMKVLTDKSVQADPHECNQRFAGNGKGKIHTRQSSGECIRNSGGFVSVGSCSGADEFEFLLFIDDDNDFEGIFLLLFLFVRTIWFSSP